MQPRTGQPEGSHTVLLVSDSVDRRCRENDPALLHSKVKSAEASFKLLGSVKCEKTHLPFS